VSSGGLGLGLVSSGLGFGLKNLVLFTSVVMCLNVTPLMRYVSRCAANRWVFNADMKLSMLSAGSRRNSGNEYYPEDRTRGRDRSTTKTCCDGVVARSADDSWLTARAALTAIETSEWCTHTGCGYDTASG